MNMADVLAQQTYIHRRSPGRCSCGEHLESPSDASHAKHLAELQLDALKAAGFAVVELPKPELSTWDESDTALFQGQSCTPVRVRWSGDVIYGSDWLSPAEARSDAACLLAAADAAEATS